tara:strand:+ start:1029 stop:1790 length:762 start_codon:yes stop_codon:yes gene_type:complete
MEFPKFLDVRRIYQNPGRILNPDSVRGGIIYGEVADQLLKYLGADPSIREGAQIGLSMPGGLVPKLGATVIGADLRRPAGAGSQIYDENTGKLTAAAQATRKRSMELGEEDPFPTFDPFGNPAPGPYDHEFKVPSPDDIVLSLSDDAKGLTLTTRARRDASLLPLSSPITDKGPTNNNPPTLTAEVVATPSSTVASEAPVEEMKKMLLSEGATNYQDFSKNEINAEYDRLRKKDPEEALRFGKDVNSVLFGYY